MKKKIKLIHPRMLATQRTKDAVLPEVGDEIYCSGVFRFNVSAALVWLEQNPLPVTYVPVRNWESFEDKEDRYVEAADLSRPIVIAEIAPDYCDFIPDFPESDWHTRGYVCIDGNHRIEKATRLGIETLPAVVLRMEQHIPFLYTNYDRYVEYWNSKLKDRTDEAQWWERGKNN